jgi:hypothetical protein
MDKSDPFDNCSCTQRHTDPQCVVHSQFQERGTGALPPPESAWQEGKTPAEIACIDMLLHVRDVLLESPFAEHHTKLVKQIEGVLRYVNHKS